MENIKAHAHALRSLELLDVEAMAQLKEMLLEVLEPGFSDMLDFVSSEVVSISVDSTFASTTSVTDKK